MSECVHGLDQRWCDVCTNGPAPRRGPEERQSFCGDGNRPGCGAEIVWCMTEAGKKMPVDPEPVENGNIMKLWVDASHNKVVRVMKKGDEWPPGRKRYVAHWSTCPNAEEFRRNRDAARRT